MARPRKTTSEQIEDRFADMPVSDQSRLLDRLQLIHRLTRRREKPEPEEEEAESVPVL